MSVITFLWSLFGSCSVWWHIEYKWHFIHVHDEVHREVVLLTVINDGPMKSDDFFLIIVGGVVVPESLLFRKPWHQWFLALKVSLRNVIFLIIGKFEGFQSHKGWKNRKSLVSLLNNLCQEINLQLQPHIFPRFARFKQGIFCKFSLLLHQSLTILSETPNWHSAAWFPFCPPNLIILNFSQTV